MLWVAFALVVVVGFLTDLCTPWTVAGFIVGFLNGVDWNRAGQR